MGEYINSNKKCALKIDFYSILNNQFSLEFTYFIGGKCINNLVTMQII